MVSHRQAGLRRPPRDLNTGLTGPELRVCVIYCDNVITTAHRAFDDEPVGHLDEITRARLDMALRYGLDIVY